MNTISLRSMMAGVALLTMAASMDAQVVVSGTTGATPHVSAMLDVQSTGKGLLVPSMTTAQRLAIVGPADGLLVYDLDAKSFFHFDGTAWLEVSSGEWRRSGAYLAPVGGDDNVVLGGNATLGDGKIVVLGTPSYYPYILLRDTFAQGIATVNLQGKAQNGYERVLFTGIDSSGVDATVGRYANYGEGLIMGNSSIFGPTNYFYANPMVGTGVNTVTAKSGFEVNNPAGHTFEDASIWSWGLNAAVFGKVTENSLSVTSDNVGVFGYSTGAVGADYNIGVYGRAGNFKSFNYGVWAQAQADSAVNYAVYATTGGLGGTKKAGYFAGDVTVTGAISKASGTFQIDHPQDPANKYLYHSFVESPDMKNIYDGTITTDANGFATVTLPDYFEALNKDFRYQLTCIGSFAQAIVQQEVANNSFVIQTSQPNVKVSWQVTGIRKDAWAEAHRVVPEVEKADDEKGKYMHPELFGQPETMSVDPMRAKMARENEQKPATETTKPQPTVVPAGAVRGGN